MKRVLIIGTLVIPLIGCVSAARLHEQPAAAQDSQPAPVVQKRAVARNVELTFLDTLNRGKEISLSEKDISTLAVTDKSVQSPKAEEETATRFRIQILASSQVETVRVEKKTVEAQTTLPVFMSLEQPYYKLYIGDFSTKAEAEAKLPEIKKKGYQDAWIVRTRAFSE